jgi:hypothetical protein
MQYYPQHAKIFYNYWLIDGGHYTNPGFVSCVATATIHACATRLYWRQTISEQTVLDSVSR